MARFFYDNFQQYLMNKGIKKVDFLLKSNDDLNKKYLEQRCVSQMENICGFHNAAMGFNGYLKERIDNDLCKLVEDFKVKEKKFSRHLEKILKEGPKNPVEELIAMEGTVFSHRAKECLKVIEDNNYMNLVRRSMDRIEICLTNCDFDNISRGNTIEVVDFSDIAYNMVEMDAYYFLLKIKRKNENIDYVRVIDEFCRVEGLNKDSRNFILAMLSYPCEFMKWYEKYKKNKKMLDPKEYREKIKVAMREDGDSLTKYII